MSTHYGLEYTDNKTDVLATRTAYLSGSGVLSKDIMPQKLVLPAAGVTLTNDVGITMLADYFDIDSWSGIVMLGISAIGGWTYSLPPLN